MVAAEFPQVRLIRESENRGYPAANNIALRTILAEKTADIVVLMNSDLAAEDRAVDRLAGHLAEHPAAAAVLPALILPDGRFQVGACGYLPTAWTLFNYFFGLHKIFPVRARSFFIDQKGVSRRVPFLAVEWLSGACLAVRRETIERIGLMSEDYFFYAEDLDWGRRMKGAGLTLHYLPSVRVVHYHGATYQDILRETNTAWLRMLFQYLRRERGLTEYVLGRAFAAAGFFLRTIAHTVGAFPWTRKASRRKIREVFRFFTFSLTGT
jgi:GT2 family glycosyltransferase